MIENKKQMFIVITAFTLILLLGTTTYAFFNYTRTGASNTIVVGNIYFNHTQGDAISLTNEFPMSQDEARNRNDNFVTFQVTGTNESDLDIYYKILLSHGSGINGKNRIDDKYLRFDLIEVLANNTEKYILYNEKIDTINNTVLLKDRVDANTSSTVTRNYKLRMWIDEGLLISDTDENRDYTSAEYENLFASVKITIQGNTQKVYYYDSFNSAITAINESSDYSSSLGRSSAKAGIYVDSFDNTTNLAMYDDSDVNEDVIIINPVNINLYGYTLNVHKDSDTTSLFEFSADSSIENGTINMADTNDGFYVGVIDSADSNVLVKNIDIPFVSTQTPFVIQSSTDANIVVKNTNLGYSQLHSYSGANLDFIHSHADGRIITIQHGNLNIIDSDLENSKEYGILMNICDTCSATVTNSTIFADSPGCYGNDNNGNYVDHSLAIANFGTLIFNSGYVFGTHSAVETESGSKTYVYGGTFESTHHGGFYFAHGQSGVAYIENANIRGAAYPERGAYRPNGIAEPSHTYNNVTYPLVEDQSAFFMGMSSNENNQKVYLVNCNISALGDTVFIMRYSTPYQSLYMSGCTFSNTTSSQQIRVDNLSNMKVFIGYNNNLGSLTSLKHSNGLTTIEAAKQSGTIEVTNANYKDAVTPE